MIAKKSTNESCEYAKKSLEISTKSYISFLHDPTIKHAAEMSLAANLAGKAIISKTCSSYVSCLPTLYNISHGHAVSLFLKSL